VTVNQHLLVTSDLQHTAIQFFGVATGWNGGTSGDDVKARQTDEGDEDGHSELGEHDSV
jgi:hypothetical protein